LQAYYYDSDTAIYFYRHTYELISKVQESNQTIQFYLYPNPASSTVFLQTGAVGLQEAKIFDMLGRLVFSRDLQGTATEMLPLSGILNGHYILQVIGKNGAVHAKPFVIEN
jgi:Secretion system C-terminal sorting domain